TSIKPSTPTTPTSLRSTPAGATSRGTIATARSSVGHIPVLGVAFRTGCPHLAERFVDTRMIHFRVFLDEPQETFKRFRLRLSIAQPASKLFRKSFALLQPSPFPILLDKLKRFVCWIEVGMVRRSPPTRCLDEFQILPAGVDLDHDLRQLRHFGHFGEVS